MTAVQMGAYEPDPHRMVLVRSGESVLSSTCSTSRSAAGVALLPETKWTDLQFG